MTEPAVASSDATNIEARIERRGDEYVINARKWWTSGAGDPRCKIDMARLLTLKAAWIMDVAGNKTAKTEIAMIKVVAPTMALQVIDWAMQAHGGGGVCEDFPLAGFYAGARTLRFADGPDEVHRNAIAKLELGKYA
jgi:acyl-CoA dehydrogenase